MLADGLQVRCWRPHPKGEGQLPQVEELPDTPTDLDTYKALLTLIQNVSNYHVYIKNDTHANTTKSSLVEVMSVIVNTYVWRTALTA